MPPCPPATSLKPQTVLGRLPPSGHCTDSRLKQPQSSFEKGLFPRASIHGTDFRFATHLETTVEFPGNISRETPSLDPTLVLLQVTGNPQMRVYIPIWIPDFCNCHPGDTFITPGLEASKVYNCSPMELYIFIYFKSCGLRVCLQST